jgi:hypothetical protein
MYRHPVRNSPCEKTGSEKTESKAFGFSLNTSSMIRFFDDVHEVRNKSTMRIRFIFWLSLKVFYSSAAAGTTLRATAVFLAEEFAAIPVVPTAASEGEGDAAEHGGDSGH